MPGRTTCTACHQRKVKCDAHDGGFPCTRCRNSGAADACRLHRKNKRVSRAYKVLRVSGGTVPLSPATTTSQRTHVVSAPRRETPPVRVESHFGRTVFSSSEGTPGNGPARHTAQPKTPPACDTNSDAATSAYSSANGSTPALAHNHVTDGEYKKYLVEFIDQPSILERPIDKHARTLYVGSALSNIHFLLRQRISMTGHSRTEAESGVTHYPTNRIAKPGAGSGGESATGGAATDGLPLEAFQLPPKRMVDQLLAAYFTHINPGFPVVDEDLFMQQYRARDPQNPPSLLLLQAILVAGAHVLYSDADAVTRDEHKAAFFRRAKMLMDARFERNRDTLVQAALLLTWHADGPEDVAANAWHWVGVAARTATGLGMHRDAEGSTLVPHNKRMWRRVWWLLFQCDVLVALQYGRPPALHLDDTDVRKLTPADFQDCGPKTQVDFVIQMTELCMLLSTDVLRSQYQCGCAAPEDARRAALRRTDEALANWSLHLPPSLQMTGNGATRCTHDGVGASGDSGPINVWTAVLHLAYNTALVVLHRQAPVCQRDNGADPNGDSTMTADDLEICTDAAVSIQQIAQAVCTSGQAASLWSSAIHCLFTALIQLSGEVRRSTARPQMGASNANNPLLAVMALRRYDAALTSLRQLAAYWPNAQGVVQFFEQSVRLQGQGGVEDVHMQENVDKREPPRTEPEEPEQSEQPAQPAYAAVEPAASHGDMTQLLSNLMAARAPGMLGFEGGGGGGGGGGSGNTSTGVVPLAGDLWTGHDWQRIYWQAPESTDDFLFTF